MRKARTIPIKSKPTFAVVVDGDCELWYLQMLKRNERSITVNIEPKIPQRKNLSEQFEIVKRLAEDYTKVFWVIDFDVVLTEKRQATIKGKTAFQVFIEYRKIIENKYTNVVVIINNPCIEFWFLLHFEQTSKYYQTCESAEKQLKKYLEGYEKTQKYYTKQGSDIYLRLKPHLNGAIKKANNLGLFDIENPYRGMSEMQLFFQAEEFVEIFKNK